MNPVYFAVATTDVQPVAKDVALALSAITESASFVKAAPSIVPAVDKQGNEMFQTNGLPVMASLDDQIVPINEFSDEERFVTTDLNGNPCADVIGAVTAIMNPYETKLSWNQHVDDQNTLHEKHGRLNQMKELESNEPRTAVVLTDSLPNVAIAFEKLMAHYKSTEKSPVSAGALKVVVLLVGNEHFDFYSLMAQKAGALLEVIPCPADANKDELVQLLKLLQ